jgi:methionyl-tRNA formyltransferase
MRSIFMGTPAFALPSLKQLVDMPQTDLIGVITQPDRPKGRGYQETASPVKQAAVLEQIPVFQPESVNSPEFFSVLQELSPELIVVVAYGQILTKKILHLPARGCLNVHASLLPKYRGAAPIQRCLIDGQKVTGVTIMKMDEGMDTGDILMQAPVVISPAETAVTLHEKLALVGAVTLKKSIEALIDGSLPAIPQNSDEATYAPRLTKKCGLINWDQTADEIDCLIRGTQPWPAAYTTLQGKTMKIWLAKIVPGISDKPPGTIVGISREGIRICTGEKLLLIQELQLEGKKKMSAEQFLLGNVLEMNIKLGD